MRTTSRCNFRAMSLLTVSAALAVGSARADCPLTFEARLVKDTILPSEYAYIELRIENHSDTAIYYRAPGFECEVIDVHLVNIADNRRIPCHCVTVYRIALDSNRLEPHGVASTYHVLPGPAGETEIVCDSPRRGWTRWPTGTYQAVLSYSYDPLGNPSEDCQQLVDTVQLVVEKETPEDARAFDAFLNAYCSPNDELTDALWQFMLEFPKSRYRALAVRIMGNRPRDVKLSVVVKEIASADPYNGNVGPTIMRLLARSGRCTRNGIVRALLDSLPNPCPVRTVLEREYDC